MTRGHYRSCGKDPHSCCVSDLLGSEPVIRSGFQQTYASDKDTGRYWEAGAANVHWVIVTDDQVERGIKLALERVKASGVLIEGNSFLKFIDVDFAVLVASDAVLKATPRLKSSTRWAFQKASALYLSNPSSATKRSSEIFARLNTRFAPLSQTRNLSTYAADDFLKLVARVNRIHSDRTRLSGH